MASQPCALNCGLPVNPHDVGVWKEVTGFVGGPKKDSMRLRTDTGRVAHNSCVAKAMAGQAPDQPSMEAVLTENDDRPIAGVTYEYIRGDDETEDLLSAPDVGPQEGPPQGIKERGFDLSAPITENGHF